MHVFGPLMLLFALLVGCGADTDFEPDCLFISDGCVCTITESGAASSGLTEGVACTQANVDAGYCACDYPEVTENDFDHEYTGGIITQYRYVLIEDLSSAATEEIGVGADIDAVGVVVENVEWFASTVEDHNISHSGDFIDAAQILGPPDASCNIKNFVSLGGIENAGWIIVGFYSMGTDVTFKPGDTINVYELGASYCLGEDLPNWSDDPYAVSVSVSNTRDAFTAAGMATATGTTNAFVVP